MEAGTGGEPDQRDVGDTHAGDAVAGGPREQRQGPQLEQLLNRARDEHRGRLVCRLPADDVSDGDLDPADQRCQQRCDREDARVGRPRQRLGSGEHEHLPEEIEEAGNHGEAVTSLRDGDRHHREQRERQPQPDGAQRDNARPELGPSLPKPNRVEARTQPLGEIEWWLVGWIHPVRHDPLSPSDNERTLLPQWGVLVQPAAGLMWSRLIRFGGAHDLRRPACRSSQSRRARVPGLRRVLPFFGDEEPGWIGYVATEVPDVSSQSDDTLIVAQEGSCEMQSRVTTSASYSPGGRFHDLACAPRAEQGPKLRPERSRTCDADRRSGTG